ncbi:hypothetical protein [Nocardia sp. NPDC050412]|uniref:hypothetical protein n=1 Tax=Nocardia sp. NPDC050412 TaxID=3364320 RepID=UPI003792D49F
MAVLRRNQDAVTTGLTLSWNSGPSKATTTRIKRQTFGPAEPDLLRERILLSA